MYRIFIVCLILVSATLNAQTGMPAVSYTITVDENDLSSYQVEMKVDHVPPVFLVGMYVHPEYDDRFYRFIGGLHVNTGKDSGTIVQKEKNLWQVRAKGAEVIINYTLTLPREERQRGAWRPFLAAYGGLVGGPQSYMYLVDQKNRPALVRLQLPGGWNIATSLSPSSRPNSFYAHDAEELFDAPILVGKFRKWGFTVNQVPHEVYYLSSATQLKFDTTEFVEGIQKLVVQANALFRGLPYKRYDFLIQDDSYGALEHKNSVTIGAPASELESDMNDYLSEIAHEYFHAWNLMRIIPAGYGAISYKKPALSKGLWWSEGLTMFYADLMMRRAGLSVHPRVEHLREIIENYYRNPGNHMLSAETLSLAAYAPPGYSGDYDGSVHLHGEITGNLFDMLIRYNSGGKRSMDDVMRSMMKNFSGPVGFTADDVERLVSKECNCNIKGYFNDHIHGNKMIDFNKYLGLLGLHLEVGWKEAVNDKGELQPDLSLFAWNDRDSNVIRLGITNPEGCWGKAGLHTWDQIVSINGKAIDRTEDFFSTVRTFHPGDTVLIIIKRKGATKNITVHVTGYQAPNISIKEEAATEKQKALLEDWKNAK